MTKNRSPYRKKYQPSLTYEIYQVLCGISNINENSQQNVDLSINLQETNSRDPRDELITKLSKQIEQLTSELNLAREQIAKLMAIHTATTENNNSQTIVNAEFPPLNGPVSQNIDNSNSQAPWRNPNKVAALKQSMYLNRQKNRIRKEEAAARFFQPPSNNQGFQYLYISTKARIPVGKLRSYLRQMGVNNARVLDIHYPDRNIVALLIHNDYAAEFKQLLETKRVHFVNNFDPWDGSTLKDSQYKDLTEQERTFKACEIQLQRLERAVIHIREPVKFAVAYYFYQQKWLSKSFIDQLNNSRYKRPEDIFDMDEDIMNTTPEDTPAKETSLDNTQH
ncbi:uncharacterized protein BX663DRAFT_440748 [Cokeromyces recurvatus]|uniref:uncharacterized protein n=1 Tax=Cokeromyces recurvatus TaxID=90255 RepID=UPI0022202542|nr:uncharacterized protein BX663DRAFT_440748 [Cokeromyces recurvatus]KAI7899761.1 hypothetical protein BX663DRAFT_440748 [Cokeromyces recurvatus]